MIRKKDQARGYGSARLQNYSTGDFNWKGLQNVRKGRDLEQLDGAALHQR